ncbi:MAG: GNAT family protein [Pseudomonadota bacterium]
MKTVEALRKSHIVMGMNLDAPGLENAFVRLSPFEERHGPILAASSAIKHMWESMPDIPKGTNFNAYLDHTLKQKEAGLLVPFAISRCSDDAFAGVVAFENVSRTHRRVRIAHYWHPKEMRSTGVFQASQALLIERAVEWGARRIGWMVSARNRSALAAVESLGPREEGRIRSFTRLADGTFSDMVVFSFLRDEAKAALPLINDRWKALHAAALA